MTVAVLHKKRSRPVRFPLLLLTPLLPLTEEARDELSAPNSFAIEPISPDYASATYDLHMPPWIQHSSAIKLGTSYAFSTSVRLYVFVR